MDADRFQAVRGALARLLTEGVQSLNELSSDVRPDGLPQNWVDDIQNLTASQRAELATDIPAVAPAWAVALRGHLVA